MWMFLCIALHELEVFQLQVKETKLQLANRNRELSGK